MTLKILKNKVLVLLGVMEAPSESALCDAIDSAAKKVALYAKSIKKTAMLKFTQKNGKTEADLPADFAAFGYINNSRGAGGREQFEIVAGKIRSARLGAGTYELVYFAYPQNITPTTSEKTELDFDDYTAYTVAYGAAAELCPLKDTQRYKRLSTEFDSRFAELITAARDADIVKNAFFAGRRI